AFDSNNNGWLPGNGGGCNCVAELASGSTSATNIDNNALGLFPIGQLSDSLAEAVDGNNAPWQANTNNKLIRFGVVNFLGNFVVDYVTATGGGLNAPATLSVDGGNNLWVANSGSNTVSGFTNGGVSLNNASTTAGFPTGSATTAVTYAAAPDFSGNLWTANSDGTVTQLLGLATPTATPVVPGQLGSKP
ncbi:MAG TPA: hypothetical protein VM865_04315, partial [Acidobacteriaceae bacterium]|nr:hypothetical protein [Acidobacteriaceae bacterium]